MKKTIYILALIMAFVSCESQVPKSDESHEGHDHSSHQNKEKDPHAGHNHDEHNHEEGESSEVVLNKSQMELLNIQTSKLTSQMIGETIEVTGQISVPPKSKASVYAPMGGFVRSGDFLPGQKVKKGQVLATLEHHNYIKLQEDFLQAYTNYQYQNKQWERVKELKKEELNSQQQYDLEKKLYNNSKVEYQSLKAQLEVIGISPKRVLDKGIQKKIVVYSPINGYVTENFIYNGKFVEANEKLYALVDNDHMHAELKVYSSNLENIHKGLPFEFHIAGISKVYKGSIALIGAEVNEEDKTIEIHGEIEDEDDRLKPGMYIQAQIFRNAKNRQVIPSSAIFTKNNENFVFVSLGDGKYKKVKITTGARSDRYVEILTLEDKNKDPEIVIQGVYGLESALLKNSGELGHGHAH
jgi:cobalt-zinc-cadmium efflux system membrane fusion protein